MRIRVPPRKIASSEAVDLLSTRNVDHQRNAALAIVLEFLGSHCRLVLTGIRHGFPP
jgi:hypothetical protein